MKSFGCARYIYNWGLGIKNEEYAKTKKSSNYYELNKKIPELKKENEWLMEVYSQSIQASLRNLDNAFTRFYKKQGKYPKFKSKNKNDYSYQIPQGVKIDKDNQKIFIPKLGQWVKIKLHKDFKGRVKTVTISRNPSGQYYATLLIECDENIKPIEKFSPDTTIGIDLGLKEFAVISDGTRIENPKFLRKKLKRLKKIQKRHSRKQKGSNNRKKHRLKVARQHSKVSNQRKDFLHKTTHDLTHKNQVSTICIEDLAVSNMIKNHKLALSIADVGWGEFRRQLEYKCNWYGKRLIVISRFAPSSKLCSECGQINSNLKLSNREWTCDCGVKHDRDLLASRNIKSFGIEQYRRDYGNSNACGDNWYETESLKQEAKGF